MYDGGQNVKRRFKSDKYKAWCVQAGRFVAAYLADNDEFITVTEPIRVTYRYATFTDKRRRDLGNMEKAVSDLLVDYKILDDDSLIHKLSLEWADDLPEGIAEIYVENL